MKVEAIIWEMKNGVVTEIKYDNVVFRINGVKNKAGRKPIILQHVAKIPVGSVFDLKDFFKKHQLKTSMQDVTYKEIARMIADNKLQQLPEDKLRVLK